jgi:hypothetical protein
MTVWMRMALGGLSVVANLRRLGRSMSRLGSPASMSSMYRRLLQLALPWISKVRRVSAFVFPNSLLTTRY